MSENQSEKKYTAMELILAISILFIPLLAVNVLAIFAFMILILFLLVFLGFAIVGVFELIAGVALVGIGIEKLFSIPMGALAVIGFGVCNIGVALLLECFVCWFYGVAIPQLFQKGFDKEVSDEKKA